MPEIGDQIQVMGTKVDQATRSGVVTDVRGRMVTIQWATGDQSVFVPAPGTLTVLGRASAKNRRTNVSAKASKSARGAIPARRSTTTKKVARKPPVRNTATKRVAKATARQPARKVVAKATGRNAPVPKGSKRAGAAQRGTTVTKEAARSRVR